MSDDVQTVSVKNLAKLFGAPVVLKQHTGSTPVSRPPVISKSKTPVTSTVPQTPKVVEKQKVEPVKQVSRQVVPQQTPTSGTVTETTGSVKVSKQEIESGTKEKEPEKIMPQPKKLSTIQLMKKQMEEKAKHEMLALVSAAIQNSGKMSKLSFLSEGDTPLQKTVKVNMALAGKIDSVDAETVMKELVGKGANQGSINLVLQEFSSMGVLDMTQDTEVIEKAMAAFSFFTKEGYENVTGVARGGTRFDKGLNGDRAMTKEEIEAGTKTLQGLIDNWATMPKFKGTKVFRVLHTGTGEDALALNGSNVKQNPTSTSVATDWSRVGDGKTCCEITIVGKGEETLPVDTRVVSTYAHEGEILLPPKTTFTKTGVNGNFTTFTATMP
jgi:hypothetical protein